MKFFALIAATQAVKLESSYDTAGGLLPEPELMRAHPEWKTDFLLSDANEHQKQRPDIYLGVRMEGPYVGGHKEFEIDHLMSAAAEVQK